jgi:hypothetical protein
MLIRIGIKTMSIHMRILPHVLPMLENHKYFLITYIPSSANHHLFYPSRQRRGLIGVIIFNILDSSIPVPYIEMKEKSHVLRNYRYQFGVRWIRIGKPWMPIPIRQNDADPTGPGSTTLEYYTQRTVLQFKYS